MPEIPDVVSGQPVASSWGNDIRDRVMLRYADSAELAAQSPFPAPGELAYLDDTQEALMWNGSQWLPIARVNYQSLLVYGDSQGYWLRPDPGDNTKDWRLVAGTDGSLVIQTRATGSFQTVRTFLPGAGAFPTVTRTGQPADTTQLTAAANTPQVLGSCAIPFAGLWRVSQSGFIEASTNANAQWTLRSRTTGGTVISEAQERNPGSSVAGWGTNARNNLAASVVFSFGAPNTLNLEILRSETGGTVLMRRWQLVAEYIAPN